MKTCLGDGLWGIPVRSEKEENAGLQALTSGAVAEASKDKMSFSLSRASSDIPDREVSGCSGCCFCAGSGFP